MIKAALFLWLTLQGISPEGAQHMQASVDAHKQGHFDVAIKEFQKATASDPNLVEAFLDLALQCRRVARSRREHDVAARDERFHAAEPERLKFPLQFCHRHDMAACARRRSAATGRSRLTDDRQAALAAGVTYTSTFGLTCPYDPCPPVIDQLLVAYDTGHMTYAFARTLWRGIEALLPSP